MTFESQFPVTVSVPLKFERGWRSGLFLCMGSGIYGFTVAIGQSFVGSVKQNELKEKKRPILRGDICKALVVLTKSKVSRVGNCYISANASAIVLISTDIMPVGNRITSPIFIEIRCSKYSKIFAIADLFV